MATYANPKAIKGTILFCNSIIFIVNCFLLIFWVIQVIGIEGSSQVNLVDDDLVAVNDGDVLPPAQPPRLVHPQNINDEIIGKPNHLTVINRFPSLASPSVRLILIVSTLIVAMIGCVGANSENSKLLHTYGYLCFICFFVKYLFIIVSIKLIGLSNSLHTIGFSFVCLMVTIGVFELVLGMSSCQFSSILKRGDAAEPKIQKIAVLKE